MYGSNMYAQGTYGQGYASVTQAVMMILHGITQGVSGFFRATRRLV